MSKKPNESKLFSKESQNVFDEYYTLIEQERLTLIKEQEPNTPDYETLVKAIIILERNVDDIAINQILSSQDFEIIIARLMSILKAWLIIFEELIRQPNFIKAFAYNLLAISNVISHVGNSGVITTLKNLIFLSPSREDLLNFNKIDSNEFNQSKKEDWSSESFNTQRKDFRTDVINFNIQSIENIIESRNINYERINDHLDSLRSLVNDMVDNVFIFGFGNEKETNKRNENILLKADKIIKNYSKNIFSSIDLHELKKVEVYEIESYREMVNRNSVHASIDKIRYNDSVGVQWDLNVIITNQSESQIYNATEIGYLLWSMSSALSLIDGVTVTLDSWENGSKKFSLKLWIDNLLAKEEVKQVLEKGRDAIISEYLDKPREEVVKIKAETEKILRETESLLTDQQIKEHNDLDIEIKKQSIEEKKIDLQERKIDVSLKKIRLLREASALLKDGIISNDSDLQIFINDFTFIEINKDGISSGEHIELYEENEIKNAKPTKD